MGFILNYNIFNIKWDNNLFFLGRNGMYKMRGINICTYDYYNRVDFIPITSKGDLGRCWLSMPVDKIPDLMQYLSKIYHERKNK